MQSFQRIVAKAMHAIIHVMRLVEFVTGCTNQKPRGAFQGKTVPLASTDLIYFCELRNGGQGHGGQRCRPTPAKPPVELQIFNAQSSILGIGN
jgi:hypothetical protein